MSLDEGEYDKIDPEFKRRWVAALRSGDYQQGRYYLEKEGCNCCLGVAARVEGVPADNTCVLRSAAMFEFSELYPHMTAEPPRNWMGLTSKTINQLTWLNDGEKLSFAQIADWIEEHL